MSFEDVQVKSSPHAAAPVIPRLITPREPQALAIDLPEVEQLPPDDSNVNSGSSLSAANSSDAPQRRVSWLTITYGVLLVGLFIFWGFIANFTTALVLPFLLIPQLFVLFWWYRNRTLVPVDAVLFCFARGLSPYAALTFLFEFVVAVLAAVLTIGWLQTPKSPTAAAGAMLMAWALLAIVEELVKYRLVVLTEQSPALRRPPGKEKLILSTAQTTGFVCGLALLQCFLYSIMRSASGSASDAETAARERATHTKAVFSVAAALTVISLPVQCLSGYLISLRVVLRDQFGALDWGGRSETCNSALRIVALPSVLRVVLALHVLLALAGFYASAGAPLFWVALVIPSLLVAGLIAAVAHWTEKRLPPEYLQRVGSLMWAYSRLTGDDDAAPPLSPGIMELARQRQGQGQGQGQERERTAAEAAASSSLSSLSGAAGAGTGSSMQLQPQQQSQSHAQSQPQSQSQPQGQGQSGGLPAAGLSLTTNGNTHGNTHGHTHGHTASVNNTNNPKQDTLGGTNAHSHSAAHGHSTAAHGHPEATGIEAWGSPLSGLSPIASPLSAGGNNNNNNNNATAAATAATAGQAQGRARAGQRSQARGGDV